jgi:hypothetical protein
MATTIKTKHSTTAGNSPSSLAEGELAINVADGNFFYGDGSAVKQNFAVNQMTASAFKGDGSALTNVPSTPTAGTVSSSAQIASDVSGSFTAASGGFSSRITTIEGAGYVDTSGTPADNQVAVFTDADTIEGSNKLKFDSSILDIAATNNDSATVRIFGGVFGATSPYITPYGSHSTLKFGDGTSGHTFDFQNNKISFDSDATNTYIMADTDNPENLEIHADNNIELRADTNLEIYSPISTPITASAGISASRIDAAVGNLVYNDVTSVTTTTPKGEIIKYGTATSAVTAGSIYRLNADGNWFKTDADFEISSSGLLGVAVSSNAADGFLIRGICDLIVATTTPTGSTLYLSTTDGRATSTPTSGSGDVIRAVGYNLNGGSQAYFNPDATYIVAS